MVAKNILRDSDIPIEAKGLYAYLSGFAGDTDECYPGISLLCSELAISKDRLYKYMNILVAVGVVERKQTHNGNIRGKVIYRITDCEHIPNSRFPENTETGKQSYTVSENPGIREIRNPEYKEISNNSFKNNILNNNNSSIVCPELDEPAPDLSGIKLPLVDKTLYDVPLDKITLWKDAYPAVDVERELKKMIAWLEANPKRRKTKRGINAFINTWLSREQDRGGRYRNGGRQQTQELTPEDYELSPEDKELYKGLGGKDYVPEPDAPFQ